jgi:hypothetical protein
LPSCAASRFSFLFLRQLWTRQTRTPAEREERILVHPLPGGFSIRLCHREWWCITSRRGSHREARKFSFEHAFPAPASAITSISFSLVCVLPQLFCCNKNKEEVVSHFTFCSPLWYCAVAINAGSHPHTRACLRHRHRSKEKERDRSAEKQHTHTRRDTGAPQEREKHARTHICPT